jgi:hypothetical protein
MGKVIGVHANRLNKTIALQMVVPLQDAEDRAGLVARHLIREIIRNELRYLLVMSPYTILNAVVLCAMYLEGVHEYIYPVAITPCVLVVSSFQFTSCGKDPSIPFLAGAENGGSMGVPLSLV